MKMQVALRFYPNQKNPARPSGRGVWRVYGHCTYVEADIQVVRARPYGEAKYLIVRAARWFKKGSRVDPVRIALDYARERV